MKTRALKRNVLRLSAYGLYEADPVDDVSARVPSREAQVALSRALDRQ